jgi:hypothetical protein
LPSRVATAPRELDLSAFSWVFRKDSVVEARFILHFRPDGSIPENRKIFCDTPCQRIAFNPHSGSIKASPRIALGSRPFCAPAYARPRHAPSDFWFYFLAGDGFMRLFSGFVGNASCASPSFGNFLLTVKLSKLDNPSFGPKPTLGTSSGGEFRLQFGRVAVGGSSPVVTGVFSSSEIDANGFYQYHSFCVEKQEFLRSSSRTCHRGSSRPWHVDRRCLPSSVA